MACGCAVPRLRPTPTARRAPVTLPASWERLGRRRLAALVAGKRSGHSRRCRPGVDRPDRRRRDGGRARHSAGGPAASVAAAAPGGADGGGLASGSRGRTGLRAQSAGFPGQRRATRCLRPRRGGRDRGDRPELARRRRCGTSMSGWRTSPGCWRLWGSTTPRTPRGTSRVASRRSCAAGRTRLRADWDG